MDRHYLTKDEIESLKELRAMGISYRFFYKILNISPSKFTKCMKGYITLEDDIHERLNELIGETLGFVDGFGGEE